MSEIKSRTLPVYGDPQICLQEVPDHISLTFSVMGCPVRCKGCHSKHLWGTKGASQLGTTSLLSYLVKYQGQVSCVCFMGGEQYGEVFVECLKLCKEMGFKTCLYTGFMGVPPKVSLLLDYLKIGPYVSQRGGLDNPNTNQRFYEMATGEDLTYKFWRTDGSSN